MNNKAQIDFKAIIALILFVSIGLPVIFAVINSLNPQCPACDCSVYQSQFQQCNATVANLSKQLNETPVKYIQNITYVDKPVEKVIYKEKLVPTIVNVLSFALSIALTISLFTIKIKLPKELEKEIKRLDKIILWVKWGSLALSLLIFLRLLLLLFS